MFFYNDLDIVSCLMKSTPRSAIIIVAAFVLALLIFGIIDASITRRLFTPSTRKCSSTQAPVSLELPIRHVPVDLKKKEKKFTNTKSKRKGDREGTKLAKYLTLISI